MAIPEQVLIEIKYRNDIETVISPYVNLKRNGRILKGLCPFHNEKTPSFTVYPDSGSFYCFGCQVGGDIFTFTKLIENLDYIEAVKLLADRSGVTLPEDGYDDSMQRLRQNILNINKESAKFFHKHLLSPAGKWALDYLIGRGLTLKSIKHFGLGAAPDNWDMLLRHLKGLGYTENDMLQANVISRGQSGRCYDRFRHRVMFPIINLRGNVIAFSGRKDPNDDKTSKFVNTSDTLVYKKGQNLFGINFAKNDCAERIILVEGNMDVVSMHQAGFTNTVGSLGTALSVEQAKLLSRYTKEIVVTLDSDEAGQKAVMAALERMKDIGLPIRVLVLPECKDPDEFIKKNGAARFKKLLEGAVSDVEYKLLRAAEGIDMDGDDGRLKYLIKAAEVLANIDDTLTVDLYENKLSQKYGVSKTALSSKIAEIRKNRIKVREKKEINDILMPRFSRDDVNPEKRTIPKIVAAEETVLSVLLQHPDLFESAYERLKPEDMISAFNKRVYTEFVDILKTKTAIDISFLGDKFTPAELGFIVSLQNAVLNPENMLNDCINVILSEGKIKALGSAKETTVDEWQKNIQDIINSKKGE